PAGTYGYLEPGEPLIWLCRDLSPTFRRFTLAHELGHVVLHSHLPIGHDLPLEAREHYALQDELSEESDDPCQAQDVSEEAGVLSQQQAEELLGPGLAYDPRSRRELAANLFAAELLMPLERVWDLYVVQGLAPDLLAARFGVSQSALFNRLTGLLSEAPDSVISAASAAVPAEREQPEKSAPMVEEAAQPAPVKKVYDEFQQAAIQTPTPALVVAGPGSGKTSTLIGRAEYLLRVEGVRPEQILALTFSRKAAQEMQERLQQILSAGQQAPTISTFHAFCADLLRNHGPRVGLRQDFALVDDAEGYFLLRGLAGSLPLNHYHNLFDPGAPFSDFLKAISRAKDELITPARYRELALAMLARAASADEQEAAERALEVAAVYDLYQQRLMQRGDSDFGGLLMLAVQLLTEHADIRAALHQRYQHILVDEFQDINRASGILLRLLAGEKRQIWVVGDANQAIYSFRGASPANIANFHEDYPDAVILPLSRNYRSRPDIVHLADTFKHAHLGQDERIGPVQTARTGEHEPYVTLAIANDEASELRGLVRDVQRKLAEGYSCRDIVVLCRTRAMVRKVTRALAGVGLPVGERTGMMEQEHTRNILSLLLLMVNNSGMGLLRAARLPAHPLERADVEALLLEARRRQTSLLALLLHEEEPFTLSSAGAQAWRRLAAIVKSLLRNSSSVWSLLARYLMLETSLVRDLLLAGDDAQAQTMRADYASLLQFAHTYSQRLQEEKRQLTTRPDVAEMMSTSDVQEAEGEADESEEGADEAPDLQEQIRGFLDYLQILLSLRQEITEKREESGEAAEAPELLRVMTVHASKGLEFPVVYLPGLAKGRFPLTKRYNPTPPPAGMLPVEAEGENAHESGEACLFYVGTTRARDQLILSHSERYGKQKASRSKYIDALIVGLPADRVRRIIWSAEVDEEGASAVDEQAEILAPTQPSQEFIAAMQPAMPRVGQIEDYLVCPRRYAYSTIYAFRRDDGTFLPFWQASEATMQALVRREEKPEPGEAAELFQHHWQAHGDQDGPFAQLYEQHGREVAARLERLLRDAQSGDWQLRQTLAVDLSGHKVEVTIDRIETPGEEQEPARFVRTRYGKSKSKPTPGMRELLYVHASRQHHAGRDVVLQTHNLSTGETHEVKVSARKEESLLNDFERAMSGIKSQDYTPKPDTYVCSTCPFYLICPA
ncbi:MAG TPA: UvrD-helicase domain-containing protein, partial [Ktedonobacteraceae bacterium]|nr:UvrD-helicase domain-containing protein [Ktedonobacteraceae bacterium]